MTETKKPSLSVVIQTEVPLSRIQDLLCCAFEGGSNYWYRIEKFTPPAQFEVTSSPEKPGEFRHLDYPVNVGGALVISNKQADDGDSKPMRRTLSLRTIRQGLQVFATKYPRHFSDFMQDNEDACTGDVFLQCCVFGEAVYG